MSALEIPCLWFRGILPASFTQLPPGIFPASEPTLCISGPSKPEDFWPSSLYYGDASGSFFSQTPALRRVGVGLAVYDDSNAFLFGVQSALPGPVQTVPRGEAFALLLAVTHAALGAYITFFTDCYPVYTTYNKGVGQAHLSVNFDVWYTIFAAIRARDITLLLLWMPSHLDEPDSKKERPGWVEDFHIAGNKEADRLAGQAAFWASLVPELWYPIVRNIDLVTVIQRRLVYIICNLPHRAKVPPPPAAPRVGAAALFDRALAVTKHDVACLGKALICATCSSTCTKEPLARSTQWLGTQCSILPKIGLLPSGAKLSVKGNFTHDSHKLATLRGLTYCIKCGCFTTSQRLQNLAKPCSKPTPTGMSNRNRLAKGLLPHSAVAGGWPDMFRLLKPPLPHAVVPSAAQQFSFDSASAPVAPVPSAGEAHGQHAAAAPAGPPAPCQLAHSQAVPVLHGFDDPDAHFSKHEQSD